MMPKDDEIIDLKLKINTLNIVIILIIIILGVLLITTPIPELITLIIGIILLRKMWKILSNTIDNYNYLIEHKNSKNTEKNSNKVNQNNTFTARSLDLNIDNDERCCECSEKISYDESLEHDGLCKKCYQEKYGEEEHYCIICGRLLTEDEYEDYDEYCEDCYSDINVHYQRHGLDDCIKPFADAIDDPDVWDDYYDKN